MFAILGLVWLFIGVDAGSALTKILHQPYNPPTPEPQGKLLSNMPPSRMTHADTASYAPFSFYAAVAYCKPEVLENWSGPNCKANPEFKVLKAGGTGGGIQNWYVGYDTTLKTVIVGHEGTDPKHIKSLCTDANVKKTHLNPALFPGMCSSIEVHSGFAHQHQKTAKEILGLVQTALQKTEFKMVTIVGHSLGAALALLDGLYLSLHIKKHGVHFRVIGYGMPRVGNAAFANYVDRLQFGQHANLTVERINNKSDIVPVIPGRRVNFVHPHGEKHIAANGHWYDCPGQDNKDPRCSTGTGKKFGVRVLTRLKVGFADHSGPYGNLTAMGCSSDQKSIFRKTYQRILECSKPNTSSNVKRA